MGSYPQQDQMMELFIHETLGLLEQLENIMLDSEKENGLDKFIDQIFRVMHTIKGSSAMMMFDGIAHLTHRMEDLFDYIRTHKPVIQDFSPLADLVFQGIDLIRTDVRAIREGHNAGTDMSALVAAVENQLHNMRSHADRKPAEDPPSTDRIDTKSGESGNSLEPAPLSENRPRYLYRAVVFFDEGCGMEDLRAFQVYHALREISGEVVTYPDDILDNPEASESIRNEGFYAGFDSDLDRSEIELHLESIPFVRRLVLSRLKRQLNPISASQPIIELHDLIGDAPGNAHIPGVAPEMRANAPETIRKAAMVSVSVDKLDALMNLVGELVIAEAMVTRNPLINETAPENFRKAARQLSKITRDLQDIAMSTRLIPLHVTFQKMSRLVRDMSRKIGKQVHLQVHGAGTEVDKNIIETLSDPLMHMIRNCIDHGIEPPEERLSLGKPEIGTIRLEASNIAGDVLIRISDDGRGLNRRKILDKARQQGLFDQPEERLSDKEVYEFIMQPGFSTREEISEFSGRGVGMDVVKKNIEAMNGTISLNSQEGHGMEIQVKIPLTLGIIDGINVEVGRTRFTIPVAGIRETFWMNDDDLIVDPEGRELLLVRGESYSLIRLHSLFNLPARAESIQQGILIMVENERHNIMIFADSLLGQQQVVIKPIPEILQKRMGRTKALAGCAMLGDGSISLVLDVSSLGSSNSLETQPLQAS